MYSEDFRPTPSDGDPRRPLFGNSCWCRREDSNPHGFPVKPLPNHLSLLFPLAALIDGSRNRILVQFDASGIHRPGRVLFAPPQNRLKAWSFVFADVLEWVPKSAGNAFPVVEIFHFRLPDSRWHLVPMPDSFTFIVPLPMSSYTSMRMGKMTVVSPLQCRCRWIAKAVSL